LFAGLFSNYFESKRRIFDKRSDKYHEHKNTIVQIEHELVPARLNLSRNIQSLEDAIKHTNPVQTAVPKSFKSCLKKGVLDNHLIIQTAGVEGNYMKLAPSLLLTPKEMKNIFSILNSTLEEVANIITD